MPSDDARAAARTAYLDALAARDAARDAYCDAHAAIAAAHAAYLDALADLDTIIETKSGATK